MRELIEEGWLLEQEVLANDQRELESGAYQPASQQASVDAIQQQEPEAVATDGSEKKLEEMTKYELIAYAEANGIEIDPYATKSKILEACLAAKNG